MGTIVQFPAPGGLEKKLGGRAPPSQEEKFFNAFFSPANQLVRKSYQGPDYFEDLKKYTFLGLRAARNNQQAAAERALIIKESTPEFFLPYLETHACLEGISNVNIAAVSLLLHDLEFRGKAGKAIMTASAKYFISLDEGAEVEDVNLKVDDPNFPSEMDEHVRRCPLCSYSLEAYALLADFGGLKYSVIMEKVNREYARLAELPNPSREALVEDFFERRISKPVTVLALSLLIKAEMGVSPKKGKDK